MTNFEKWKFFMKDCSSPDGFIDFGFYYMISAALQRRVWLGHEMNPLFPNQYIILVGEPGMGKGQVLKPIINILKHWKLKDANGRKPQEDLAIDVTPAFLQDNAPNSKLAARAEEPLLIPVAADSTTYESLVNVMSKATRGINYTKFNEKIQRNVPAVYMHSSLCFALEELSSLFRKKTENIVNFLLVAFDCGDYTYETKTQGTDRIKKCCLNFLGGTTPSFMQTTFNDNLLGEGFSSRTIFVYEAAKRHHRWKGSYTYSKEQLEAREDILNHILLLSKLHGQVTYTKEAEEYLKHWFEEVHPFKRANNNLKLVPYYERKDMHLQKMAMAVHFSERTDKEIGIESCIRAMTNLDEIETRMHYALSFGGNNPLAKTQKEVIRYMKKARDPQGFKDLFVEFVGDVREHELQEVLRYLQFTGQIEEAEVYDVYLKTKVTKYQIKTSEYSSREPATAE